MFFFFPMSHFIRFRFAVSSHTVSGSLKHWSRNALKEDIFWIWRPTFSHWQKRNHNTTHKHVFVLFVPLQLLSASFLRTTMVIYGNYPSLGSSIKWLLLGDGSSCCFVGGKLCCQGQCRWIQKTATMREGLKLCHCGSSKSVTDSSNSQT